ncbi:MAG: DNA-binding response regulator [Runella slithyformis]|nr:MAG: DNA-binding response regulator [Runella slithyformis]
MKHARPSVINILLVEDKHLIAEAFSRLLSDFADLSIVAIASNHQEAIFQLNNHQIDLVLLDLQIPLRNLGKTKLAGFDVLEYTKTHFQKLKTIILSNYNEHTFIKKAEQLGAKGYLLKNTTSAELYRAIQMVHKGGSYFQVEVEKQLQTKQQQDEDQDAVVGFAKLTRREKEVTKLLAHGFTSRDIASALFIKASTVDEYRDNIMVKLEAKNTAEMIRIIYENGLLDD